METVNNVVNAASKAIWGNPTAQSGEEPVSGQTGAGTVNEPYDKGNVEETGSHAPLDSTTGRSDAGSRPGDVRPTEANESRPNTNAGGFGTAEPSVGATPTSGSTPQQKHEGADRPMETPGPKETEAVKEKKELGEEKQTGQKHITSDEEREKLAEKGELPHDPNDHSGEPMKMHDSTSENTTEQKVKKDRSASVAHEGGGEHGKVKGTGEEWVKTSGLAAEGGDFDATKPGAGREANRILEQKGIHKDAGGKQKDEGSPTPSSEEKKVSKMGKLKEKLHIGTGKHI